MHTLKLGDFLPVVEKTPLIVTLGHWVLDHACEQMHAWRGAKIAPQIVAINLSVGQLRTGDEFVGAIIQTLTKWGLAPMDLELACGRQVSCGCRQSMPESR